MFVRAPSATLRSSASAHLVAVLVEHQLRGLPGLESLRVRRLVGQDQVGEARPVQRVDALLGDEPAVRVELDRDAARFGVGHDLRQLGVEHRLAHLVQLHREQRPEPGALLRDLVHQPEHALLLHEAAPAVHDLVGAPGALEVAGVRDLDEQVVDRVEAAGELPELGHRGRGGKGRQVGRRGEAHAHAVEQELAAELEAERGPEVLRPRGVEVGEVEDGAPEALEPDGVRLPALLARPGTGPPRSRSGRSKRIEDGTPRTGRPSTRPRRRRRQRRGALKASGSTA